MSKAPAVDYALQILERLAKSEQGEGISSLSADTGINKTAVSRVLEALTEGGWVYCNDPEKKRYALTLRPFTLMAQGLDTRDLMRTAMPYVRQLAEETLDSAYLAVPDEREAIYLAHCDGNRDVRISGRVGGRYPLHCSAPGKVLLAFQSEECAAAYFDAPTEKRTFRTVTEWEVFRKEREEIRRLGYAVDNEEFGQGILCMAAPIFDASDRVIAAVGISTSTVYCDAATMLAEQGKRVLSAAEHITALMGGKING